MTKWTGRLRQLFDGPKGEPSDETNAAEADGAVKEGSKYLNRVRDKLDRLVEDFANGRVNQAQFEELYTHYQNERNAVERLMTSRPSSNAWRMAVTEGQSINIRRRLAARVVGYAVYVNHDETPLRVYGEFSSLDPKWVSPLLARVRSSKLFVVGSFETASDEETCLCAVSGQITTLLVLFTKEPARIQLQSLEDLHSHFEQANYRLLSKGTEGSQRIDPARLVFPYAAAFE